jgi:tetratricopeptide (TPR) repeat protein
LDDIETLDAESAALLRVHRDSDCVWMLGATSHADVAVLWGEPWPMRGLDRASLETLVRATQTPLSDEVLEQLSERTQGHPLFFLQTLALLREGGDLSATLSVVEVVAARIERLAGSHAHAWKVASVLRDAFSTEDLAMLGVLDALSEVRYLRAHGVLELNASGGCVFVSDVFRRAAKSLLSHDQAALLHREAASLYARRSAPPWSRVAEHYLAAGDTLRASDAYAFAALGASAVPCSDLQHGGSRPEASFALRAKWSASALMHDSEGRADATELRLLQMDALESEGHFDQVLSAIAALDSSAWTSDQEARILVRQGTALQRMGKHEAALLVFHRAETTARENSDSADTVALALGRHAVCLALAGRLEEARDRLWEAEALVQQHAPQRRADLAGWRAQVAGLSGDLAARRDAYWTAVELFREAGNARFAAFSLLNLGDTYTRLGAYDEALPALARAHTECTILGATLMAGYASLNLGYVQAHLDQTEEAERRMDEAEATAERGGDARLLRYCLLYRARLHIEGDAPVRPYEALGRLLAESDDAQTDAAWRAMSLAVLARRALVLGETNEALRLAREAREVVVQADAIEEGEADVDVVLADALDAAGLADESNLTVQRAVRRIRDAAKRIAGAHWRTRFLQDVPAHRDLLSRVL